MANIVAVSWLHRAVRSENMLSLDGHSSRVFLIGFTYSRPDDPSQKFSNLPQQPDWERYRPLKSSPRRSEDGNSSDDEDDQGDEPDSKTETLTSCWTVKPNELSLYLVIVSRRVDVTFPSASGYTSRRYSYALSSDSFEAPSEVVGALHFRRCAKWVARK